MLSGEQELKCMKEKRMQGQISILKCPKFWRESSEQLNLRANSLRGREQFDIEWGYLLIQNVVFVNGKTNVLENVNIKILVNYM